VVASLKSYKSWGCFSFGDVSVRVEMCTNNSQVVIDGVLKALWWRCFCVIGYIPYPCLTYVTYPLT
jgi:hypothetical protein